MSGSEILGALEAAFIDEHKELARSIKALRDAPLTEVIPTLSRLERTPGLEVAHFGLIAAAMQALLNPHPGHGVSGYTPFRVSFPGMGAWGLGRTRLNPSNCSNTKVTQQTG